MTRNTSTGAVLEAMILPALARGGYAVVKQPTIGTCCGGGVHRVDTIATRGHERILVSLKWQQTGDTAEQKVPFEVMCLADAVAAAHAVRTFLVLGGGGWKLRDLLAAPFIMVQVWRFIAPGQYAKERNSPFRSCC